MVGLIYTHAPTTHQCQAYSVRTRVHRARHGSKFIMKSIRQKRCLLLTGSIEKGAIQHSHFSHSRTRETSGVLCVLRDSDRE